MKPWNELTEIEKERMTKFMAKLFDEEGPTAPEEIDEQLRIAGYDPDEVGRRMAMVAENALASTDIGQTLINRLRSMQRISSSVVDVLEKITGQSPEPQEEIAAKPGNLGVLERHVDDLEMTVKRILALVAEVDHRIGRSETKQGA